MEIGATLRNMGLESTAQMMLACANAAQERGVESIWITDHIAIPPDDAQGSGGRYLDTLTTLAWLAGVTSGIKLGSGVLIVPYRAALPTAKQVATVQELSGHRLILGVGVGWMDPEFRALGIDRHRRGAMTDETLRFFNTCFAHDEVTLNGQPFLFKPRPPKPPILVGGAAPHAIKRAAELADGWLPMANHPHKLAEPIAAYRHLTDALGKPPGNVTVMTGLPLDDPSTSRQTLDAYRRMGVDRVLCAIRYTDADGYQSQLDKLMNVTA